MFLVIALGNPGVQAAPVSSTFDGGPEGWMVADINWSPWTHPPQVVGYYPPAFHATGGNPGGLISMTDPSGQWFWFDAPAVFLGNQSSAFGHSLSFDMQVSASVAGAADGVMLVGSGMTLHYETPVPAATFTHFVVPLTPAGWRINDPVAGLEPTAAQMLGVLGNLSALRISGDWLDGTETAGLDNVVLSGTAPIPAPGALLLVLSGLACLRVVKRRSR